MNGSTRAMVGAWRQRVTRAAADQWHVIVATVITGVVGAWSITVPTLWRDEIITWTAASRSLFQLARVAHKMDAVIAPYYAFMSGWVSVFGDSPLSLRLPSLLAMAATGGLSAAIGNRLGGRVAGVVAGLIFACLIPVSRYAQEARPYAFACFFAALATLLLLRAWEQPSRRRWLVYGLALTLTGWAHLLAFTILAGHGLAVLAFTWRDRRRAPWRGWVASAAVASLAVAPLAVVGMRQQAQVGWLGLTTWHDLPMVAARVVGSTVVAGVLCGLAAAALVRRRLTFPLVVVVLTAALPFLLLYVVGTYRPLFHDRYVLIVLPAFAALAGAALARVPWVVPAVVVVLLAGLGLGGQAAIRAPGGHSDAGLDHSVAFIRANLSDRDAIAYDRMNGWLRLGADYYFGDGARPSDPLVTRTPVDMGSYLASECEQPSQCLAGSTRVWVLCVGDPADPLSCLDPSIAGALRESFRLSHVEQVDTVQVAVYTRNT